LLFAVIIPKTKAVKALQEVVMQSLARGPVTKHPNSINASSRAAIQRTNKSVPRKGQNHQRLAEILFTGFITEIVMSLRNDRLADLTPAELLAELLRYSKNGGKRLLVRMPSGRLQVHRAFDWNNPGTSYPVIETEQPDDKTLPIYSRPDFSYLDGLARDLRDKADELGLSWKAALAICKRVQAHKMKTATAFEMEALAGEKLKNSDKYPTLSIGEVMSILDKSRSSIYRLLEEGKLKRPSLGRKPDRRGKVMILTSSVLELLEESPD
jgi:hypothetical protein